MKDNGVNKGRNGGETSCCTFGEHLTIDGYGGCPKKLNDSNLVHQSLNDLPELLGMTKLAAPQVHFAPGNNAKDPGGWSGFVIIAESHMSIHTFPGRRFVSIDVYSYRNGMDCAFIQSFFQENFDLKELETNFINRGPATRSAISTRTA